MRDGATNVIVLVPDLSKGGGIASYYGALQGHLGGNVRYLPRGSRKAGGRGVLRLLFDYVRCARALLASPRPGLLHVNTSLGRSGVQRDAVFVLLGLLLRRKVLVFFRGWDPSFEAQVHELRYRFFIQALLRADCIVVLSGDFEQKLRAWGYRGPILVESTTVAEPLLAGLDSQVVKGKFQDGCAPLVLLFLGRIHPLKGIYEVLDTFRLLKADHPELRLLVAGDGADLPRVRATAAEYELADVEFLGYVRDEAKRLAFLRSHVYLFPSSHGEGMPNSVLEAMASGLVVVTRRVAGVADFFVDERMGRITDSHSPEELAALIRPLLADRSRAAKIAVHNHEYASQRFRASSVADRLMAIYAWLLNPEERTEPAGYQPMPSNECA